MTTTLQHDPGKARDAAVRAHADLMASITDSQRVDIAEWLEALAAQHVAMMLTCKPEALADTRLRLTHLLALADAVRNAHGHGFVF